ncbi:MAG: hypothetical protein WBW92_03765 [Rhodanobacteraceae bacterium]
MLWIIGTSVSIEDGGYAVRLQTRARLELGIVCTNLSVGDQTSMMGCMRVMQHLDEFSPGDVVVWEYSLLDTLLTDTCFPASDTHAARRLAWRQFLERQVSVLVLMTPPRNAVSGRTACEQRIARDADMFGIPCIDVRDAFVALHISRPARHYRDDRHPRVDSPVVDFMMEQTFEFVARHHGVEPDRIPVVPPSGDERHWRWLGASALAEAAGLPVRAFRNSLMTVQAVALPVDAATGFQSDLASRIVSLGVLSTHASGGAWCGHQGCAPASTRLPAELDYAFLLRATGLPCVRGTLDTVASAPGWAYARGVWAAYGQAVCDQPGDVMLFGMFYVPAGSPDVASWPAPIGDRSLKARVWRRLRRWLHDARAH